MVKSSPLFKKNKVKTDDGIEITNAVEEKLDCSAEIDGELNYNYGLDVRLYCNVEIDYASEYIALEVYIEHLDENFRL